MAGAIEQLKQSRWWKPAVRKYAEHLLANKRQHCQGESVSFSAFANDILTMPEHLRDDLLKEETPEELEFARLQNAPSVRYRQYDAPSRKELSTSLTMRQQNKKRRR